MVGENGPEIFRPDVNGSIGNRSAGGGQSIIVNNSWSFSSGVQKSDIATLIPGIYNRETPKLFDIPFFYWYQMAVIPVGVLCVVLVYRSTRGER